MPNQYSVYKSRPAMIPIGPSIAYLPLSSGYWSLIDREDAIRAEQFYWTATKCSRTGRVYGKRHFRVDGKRTNMGLHRFIIQSHAPSVDHRNMNGLDNRKSNLRDATLAQQQHNQGKSRNNTSGFKGVTWNKQSKKWQAYIMKNGNRKFLGLFSNPEDGGKAYAHAAEDLHGDFAHV